MTDNLPSVVDLAAVLGISQQSWAALSEIKVGDLEIREVVLKSIFGNIEKNSAALCFEMGVSPQDSVIEIARVAYAEDGHLASRDAVIAKLIARKYFDQLTPEDKIKLASMKAAEQGEDKRMRVGAMAKMKAAQFLLELMGLYGNQNVSSGRKTLVIMANTGNPEQPETVEAVVEDEEDSDR